MSEDSRGEPKYGYGNYFKGQPHPVRHAQERRRGECSTCGRYACQVHEQQQFVLDELAALPWPEKP